MFLEHKGKIKKPLETWRYWVQWCNERNPPEHQIPLPERDDSPEITVRKLVSLVVERYQMSADRAWEQTIADLCLMLTANTQDEEVKDTRLLPRELKMFLDELTPDERRELEEWKDQRC